MVSPALTTPGEAAARESQPSHIAIGRTLPLQRRAGRALARHSVAAPAKVGRRRRK